MLLLALSIFKFIFPSTQLQESNKKGHPSEWKGDNQLAGDTQHSYSECSDLGGFCQLNTIELVGKVEKGQFLGELGHC